MLWRGPAPPKWAAIQCLLPAPTLSSGLSSADWEGASKMPTELCPETRVSAPQGNWPNICDGYQGAILLLRGLAGLKLRLRGQVRKGGQIFLKHISSRALGQTSTKLYEQVHSKTIQMATSSAAQCLGLHLPMQETWAQSLVGELRSHMLWGSSKKKKKIFSSGRGRTKKCKEWASVNEHKLVWSPLAACSVSSVVSDSLQPYKL